nr:pollen-specific leucine-rich repeat extensin-like protein 2 [Procambarus clarkii]
MTSNSLKTGGRHPRKPSPEPANQRPDKHHPTSPETLPPPTPNNPIPEPARPPASPISFSPVPSPTPSPPPILPPLQHPQPHRPPFILLDVGGMELMQVPFPQHPSPTHPDPPGPEDEDRASPEASGKDNNDDERFDESQVNDNVDEEAQLEQEPDEVDQPEQQPDEAAQEWVLEPFYAPLLELLRSPDWDEFASLLKDITEAVQAHCNIRIDDSRPAPTAIDVNDCKAIQLLYRRNRRRAVRLITSGESSRCDIPCEIIERHFSEVLAAQPPIGDPEALQSIPEAQEDRASINLDPIREGEVEVRLITVREQRPRER